MVARQKDGSGGVIKKIELPYTPTEKQKILHGATAKQILFGGAAGGAKSTGLRWDLVLLCLENPGLDAYLFRRKFPDLEKTHIRRIKSEIPPELGTWHETHKRIEFSNGSHLSMCHAERDQDVENYLSAEMHVVGIDEAVKFTERQIRFIRSRVRLGSFKPVQAFALPRMVLTSNPGGPSHDFLKTTFKIGESDLVPFIDKETGWGTLFIPAKMQDNPHLDADYSGALDGLPPELARAYKEGDWDSVEGQALHSLSRERHCLRSFVPPKHWTRFSSIDFGTAKPFSVGWYTVSEGAILKGNKLGSLDKYIPSGALIRYAEWYGWNGKADQGCRLDSAAIAREMKRMEDERGEVMDYRIADTAMWAQTDGPSPIERMGSAVPGMVFRQAVKDRKANYHEFLARLAGSAAYFADGKVSDEPMFYATENCAHFWRTVPALQLDDNDPDKGPGEKQENHCYDETVYALRSRPFVMTSEARYLKEHWAEIREAKGHGRDPYQTA